LTLLPEDAGQREVFKGLAQRDQNWGALAFDAERPAALDRGRPADTALACGGLVKPLAKNLPACCGSPLVASPVSCCNTGQYTGPKAADAAKAHGIRLEVVKLPAAKRGFVPLPRHYEGYVSTLANLHLIASVCLVLKQTARLKGGSSSCDDRMLPYGTGLHHSNAAQRFARTIRAALSQIVLTQAAINCANLGWGSGSNRE
jgi:hypothetical protein